jgi:ATP-dependent DNA helicase RecG
MRANPTISASQLAEKIGISKRKILENISKLKLLGLVQRIGSAKGGYWIVVEH